MEWISVKTRLPAKDQRVLVWLEYDDEAYKAQYEDGDYFDPLPCSCCRWMGKVTHWMPLPQSPEDK